MKIKRYTFDELNQKLVEDPNGKYVRIEDAAKLAHEYRNQGTMAGSFLADENADELREAQELLRWRKFPDETPEEESDNIAVCYGHIDYRFYRTGSDWRGITHWRPIGPMPSQEVKP